MTNGLRICLWFDTQAEEAARFYTSVFKDSSLGAITPYPEAALDVSGKEAGSVMTVEFEVNGQSIIGLNGGPSFRFNEAVSLMIECEDQAEVDYYWDRLTEDGDPAAQQCGWLKDRFGVSWQVVPRELNEVLANPDPVKSERAAAAMLQMKKLDIDALRRAAEGA